MWHPYCNIVLLVLGDIFSVLSMIRFAFWKNKNSFGGRENIRGDKVEVGNQEVVIQVRFVLWTEVFMSSPNPYVEIYFPIDGIWRWDFEEVIDHEGRSHELVLLKRDSKEFPCPFPTVRTQREEGYIFEPGSGFSPDSKSASALILNFSVSTTARNKFLLFLSFPVYGICLSSPNGLWQLCKALKQSYSHGGKTWLKNNRWTWQHLVTKRYCFMGGSNWAKCRWYYKFDEIT